MIDIKKIFLTTHIFFETNVSSNIDPTYYPLLSISTVLIPLLFRKEEHHRGKARMSFYLFTYLFLLLDVLG